MCLKKPEIFFKINNTNYLKGTFNLVEYFHDIWKNSQQVNSSTLKKISWWFNILPFERNFKRSLNRAQFDRESKMSSLIQKKFSKLDKSFRNVWNCKNFRWFSRTSTSIFLVLFNFSQIRIEIQIVGTIC